MRSQMRRSSGFYGGSRLPVMLMLLVVACGCVLVYRHFFQRQGEAAASLIPQDATMVVTVDLKPSPEQVQTFQSIRDALQREKLDRQFDSWLGATLSNSPIGKDLRPFVTTSMAFATLKPGGPGTNSMKSAASVALFAVSDSGHVRDILAKDAQKSTANGMEYYEVKPGDHMYMAVVGEYFVVGDTPTSLLQIVKVHRGEAPSIATQPDFQHARAALPGDANMMIFIPPDGLRQAAGALAVSSRNLHTSTTPWVAMGMVVRPGGIETYVQVPFDAPAGSDLSHIAPLDLHLLDRLPAGAYGLMALSQPSKYWSSLVTAGAGAAPLMGGNPQSANRAMNEGIASFERETGMSVPRDVLPGFHGNALLAIYPDTVGGAASSVDGLIVLDDANGADPAALADRVRSYIEHASSTQGQHPVRFTSRASNGATVWSVDASSQDQLRQALGAAATQAQQGVMPGSAPGGPMATPSASQSGIGGGGTSPGSNQSITITLPNGGTETIVNRSDNSVVTTIHRPDGNVVTTTTGPNGNVVTTTTGAGGTTVTIPGSGNGNGSVQPTPGMGTATVSGAPPPAPSPVQSALTHKTLLYAQVGHAVLIASSQSMMDRALAAYTQGAGGLAEGAAYAQMIRQTPAGAQTLLMVDLPGIMEALRPLLTKSMAGSNIGPTPDDILHMFGQRTGIIGTQQYDGKVVKGYFFMPLNYDKIVHIIGAAQKASGGPNAIPPPAFPVAPPAPTGNGGVVQ